MECTAAPHLLQQGLACDRDGGKRKFAEALAGILAHPQQCGLAVVEFQGVDGCLRAYGAVVLRESAGTNHVGGVASLSGEVLRTHAPGSGRNSGALTARSVYRAGQCRTRMTLAALPRHRYLFSGLQDQ